MSTQYEGDENFLLPLAYVICALNWVRVSIVVSKIFVNKVHCGVKMLATFPGLVSIRELAEKGGVVVNGSGNSDSVFLREVWKRSSHKTLESA